MYHQDSFGSFGFESDSTASEQDSPIQDILPICSSQDGVFVFLFLCVSLVCSK